jgi:hypothetical protein
MRRFNYDENEEYREDVDKFFSEEGGDISDEQYKAIMEEEMQLQQLQVRFVYRDLNHRVLRSAIRMCEKSFWWWFYSQDTRLRMIDRAYKRLRKLEEEQ